MNDKELNIMDEMDKIIIKINHTTNMIRIYRENKCSCIDINKVMDGLCECMDHFTNILIKFEDTLSEEDKNRGYQLLDNLNDTKYCLLETLDMMF